MFQNYVIIRSFVTLVSALLACTSGGFLVYSQKKIEQQTADIATVRRIITNLDEIRDSLKDTERGQNSYFLTKDNKYLKLYEFAVSRLPEEFELLEKDLDTQQVKNLRSNVFSQITLLDKHLKLYRKSNSVRNIFELDQSSQHLDSLMSDIENEINLIKLDQKTIIDGIFINRDNLSNIQSFSFVFMVVNLVVLSVLTINSIRTEARLSNQHAELLERELHRELRLKQAITHDLKNPLASLHSSWDLLNLIPGEDEERRKKVSDRGYSSLNRMRRLIDRMLITTSKDVFFARTSVDIKKLTQEIIDEVLTTTTKHNFNLLIQGNERLLELDESHTEVILANLLYNAVKFSPKGGEISVNIKFNLLDVELRVRDCGIGIPASEIDTLLEVYTRASNARTIKGTGLGLAIVKNSVELHKGKITINSVEGEWAEFCIVLPG